MRTACLFLLFWSTVFVMAHGKSDFQTDLIPSPDGDVRITFIGHGTLMIGYQGKVIHVDPVSGEADYDDLPDADIILITHAHFDHLDESAVSK